MTTAPPPDEDGSFMQVGAPPPMPAPAAPPPVGLTSALATPPTDPNVVAAQVPLGPQPIYPSGQPVPMDNPFIQSQINPMMYEGQPGMPGTYFPAGYYPGYIREYYGPGADDYGWRYMPQYDPALAGGEVPPPDAPTTPDDATYYQWLAQVSANWRNPAYAGAVGFFQQYGLGPSDVAAGLTSGLTPAQAQQYVNWLAMDPGTAPQVASFDQAMLTQYLTQGVTPDQYWQFIQMLAGTPAPAAPAPPGAIPGGTGFTAAGIQGAWADPAWANTVAWIQSLGFGASDVEYGLTYGLTPPQTQQLLGGVRANPTLSGALGGVDLTPFLTAGMSPQELAQALSWMHGLFDPGA